MKLNNLILILISIILIIILNNNESTTKVNGQQGSYINDDEQPCIDALVNKIGFINWPKTNGRYACVGSSVCVNGSLTEFVYQHTPNSNTKYMVGDDLACFPNLVRIETAGITAEIDFISYPFPKLKKAYIYYVYGLKSLPIKSQVTIPDLTLSGNVCPFDPDNYKSIDLYYFNNCEQVTISSFLIVNISQTTRINRLTIYPINLLDLKNLVQPLSFLEYQPSYFAPFTTNELEKVVPTFVVNGTMNLNLIERIFTFNLSVMTNTMSTGGLYVAGILTVPTDYINFQNSKLTTISIIQPSRAFTIAGKVPIKINKNQNLRLNGARLSGFPDLSQFGANRAAMFDDCNLSGPLPEYNSNLRFLSYANNRNITSTIPASYCNVEFDISNCNVTGEIPECFRCYLRNPVVKARFASNLYLTNFYSLDPCPSFAPIIKVLNATHFLITGSTIGYSPASDWLINNTISFWNITSAVNKEYYGILYPPTSFNGVNYFSMLFNAPDGRNLTFPATNTQPAPTSVIIVSSTKLQLIGTFFSSYYNYDNKLQTVTLNTNTPCTVENLGYNYTNFFGLTCNFASAMPTTTDDQLLTMVTNGLTRRVYIKTTSTSVANNKACPNYCVDNDHGICNLNSGICTCLANYTRADCSGLKCPVETCPGFGYCDYDVGKCKCNPDYQGENCDIPYKQCPFVDGNLCNNAGTCNNVTGSCVCDQSHQGELCTIPFKQCPIVSGEICNAGGSCNNQTGICTCDSNHQGTDCSIPYIQCPIVDGNICNNQGSCNDQTGICSCTPSYQGSDCTIPFIECKDNCNSVGTCNNQTGICNCIPGRILDDCSGYECYPKDCYYHGDCNYSIGECKCFENLWYGKDCLDPYHYITSVIPTSTQGGNTSLFGVFSDKHDNPSVLIGTEPCPITYLSSNEIQCTVPPGNGIKSVTLIQNNITFIGNDLFHYLNPIKPCPNQCSVTEFNKHTCDTATGICSCVNGYGSFDCSTLTINGNGTEETSNLPKSTTTIDGYTGSVNITNELTNFIINLKSLKEIDGVDGLTIIKEYPLSNNKWTIVTDSDDNVDSLIQTISINHNSTSTIKISASNEPSSIDGIVKISISISNYQFSSFINTLQLSMITSVDEVDTPCNSKATELEIVSNGSDGNPVYIKISRNLKILSGKFNNQVESDGRQTYFITTANTQPPSSIVVSLLLPHCTVECLVVADFQLLISPDYKPCKLNSISSNWKTPVAVCISVVGVGILASFGVYKYKKGNSVPLRKRAITLKNMLTNKKVDLFMGDDDLPKSQTK